MFNLYGDKNWTVRIGLWEKLRNKLTTIEGQSPLNNEGQPTTDFVRVIGITADEATWLIENLPTEQLNDRQNNGPTLKCLLNAGINIPGIVLHGYLIGPQRSDERISIDTIEVPNATTAQFLIKNNSTPEMNQVWRAIEKELELDAQAEPDEVIINDTECVRLWWD